MKVLTRRAEGLLLRLRNRVRGNPVVLGDIDPSLGESTTDAPIWSVAGVRFRGGRWNRHADKFFSRSLDGDFIVKVQITAAASKELSLAQEAAVIADLLSRRCQSVPRVAFSGEIDAAISSEEERSSLEEVLGAKWQSDSWLVVQEWIPATRRVALADVALAVSEQRGLGIDCGDLKSSNLRFDSDRGICMFVDFDQAQHIDGLDATAEHGWISSLESTLQRFGHVDTSAVLVGYAPSDDRKIFRSGALDLSKSTLFRRQETTRAKGGGYHALDSDLYVVDGVRDLLDREPALEKVSASEFPRVLDVGANLGLASHYFAQRGCSVTATDLDASVVRLGQMVANGMGLNIHFLVNRLGVDPLNGEWDLALLFSVLHHTPDVEASAREIRRTCGSVLLEVRLKESGKAPTNGDWQPTSRWHFDSLEDLSAYLEGLFAPCYTPEYLGPVDKDRHMFLIRFSEGP
jgi:SAM-dependent methyltransferase